MANSYYRIIIHCVWSTKQRQMLIDPTWEEELWSYIAGTARNHRIHPIQVGGIDNHIHALVEPPKNMDLTELIELLKTPSSGWINRSQKVAGKFNWQDGYGAFSASPSQAQRVIEYIRTQREHHQQMSFEEEYRELMRWHSIDYEEAYLLG